MTMTRRLLVAALVLLATSAHAAGGRKQSTTANPVQFLMVSSTDHLTPATGLTVTVTCSKNGGSFAACSGAVSEVGNGVYSFAGNATDRDTLGELVIRATATGADPAYRMVDILRYDPFDDLQTARFDNLDNAIADPQDQADVILATLLDGGAGESVDAALQRLAGVSTHSAADVWAAGTRTLTSFGSLSSDVTTIKGVTDKLDTALELDGATYRYTTNALEQAPSGGGGGGDPWATSIPGSYTAGQAGHILGNRLDVAVGTRMAAGANVTITTAPVAVDGTVTIYAGTDYIGADALIFANQAEDFTDVSAVVLRVRNADGTTVSINGSVLSGTQLKVELTNSNALTANATWKSNGYVIQTKPPYLYQVQVTRTSPTRSRIPFNGGMIVRERVAP